MYFDVRVIAFDPSSTEDPVEALVRVFRVERAIARELVNRLPRVIKRGVTLETAQKFCDVLERLGATTEIVMSAPKEPAPAAPPAREPARNTGSGRGLPAIQGGGRPPAMPAPSAGAVVGQQPANANAFAQAPERASAMFPQPPSTVFRNNDSSVFFLPEPMTSDTMRLPPRGSAARAPAQTAPLEDVRVRHGLPAPREPDPLEADIHHLVDRAPAEAPSVPTAPAPRPGRPSRRPTLAQEPEEVRVTYNPRPPNTAAAEAAMLVPAPEPPRRAPAEPAPTAPRAKRRSFRPARPVPEFEPAPPPAPTALMPAEEGPLFRDLPQLDAPPAARPPPPLREAPPREVVREAPAPLQEAPLPAPEVAAPSRESVAFLPVPSEAFTLPVLSTAGPVVDRKTAELRGSRDMLAKIKLASWLLFTALALLSVGLVPLIVLGIWLWDTRRRWLRVRAMQGSAVPIGPAQLPELHGWVTQLALRLELAKVPRVYLGRGGGAEIVAAPLRGDVHLLIDSEAFARHVREGSVHVMTFLLAHELSRHALGHDGRTRAALAASWPMLGRIDALAADALATQLMGDRTLAQRALLALLAGSTMAEQLDLTELERQGASFERDAAVYAPALATGTGFLLARLYHMRHGYKKAAARDADIS